MARRDWKTDQQYDKERSMVQGKEGSDPKQLPLDWHQMGFQEERKWSLPCASLWIGICLSPQAQLH